MKKKTITSLDKKLWKLFSRYIRLRDCLETTGTKTHGKCCTCGRVLPFKKLQAGHYIPRQFKTVRYDERNVNAQGYACNMFYGGNPAEYREFLVTKYGEEVVQELVQLQRKYRNGDYIKMKHDWYENKIEEITKKIKELEEEDTPTYSIQDLPF